MSDTLKSTSPEWFKRQRRHRHNSFLGFASMTKQNMVTIVAADSTTIEAKEIAKKIYNLSVLLTDYLKTRVD